MVANFEEQLFINFKVSLKDKAEKYTEMAGVGNNQD